MWYEKHQILIVDKQDTQLKNKTINFCDFQFSIFEKFFLDYFGKVQSLIEKNFDSRKARETHNQIAILIFEFPTARNAIQKRIILIFYFKKVR